MRKVLHAVYALLFFFALPLAAYRATSFYIDRYFRLKAVPYPSEPFALAAGVGACFWTLGVSFFIHGYFFNKKGGENR